MTESFVQVTEGAGKKLHTKQRSIGANTVEDEVVLLGEQYLPSYVVVASAQSVASGANPPLVLMAGTSLKLRIRRIRIELRAAAAAGVVDISIRRCTSAPTGGVAITPVAFDTADPAPGATAMSAPTGGAVASTQIERAVLHATSAAPQSARPFWEWAQLPNQKPIIVAAGTSNGLRIEISTGVASGSATVTVEFDEASF